MFKRVTWMGVGMVVGAAGAFRAKRKAEEVIDRYLPEQVADRAADSARMLGQTVRAAAAEGREAMRSTEAELRARVDARTFVGDSAPGSRPAPTSPVRPSAGPRRQPRVPRAGEPATAPRRRARR